MPPRGILFIGMIAVLVCLIMRDEIYLLVKAFFEEELNEKKENEEE